MSNALVHSEKVRKHFPEYCKPVCGYTLVRHTLHSDGTHTEETMAYFDAETNSWLWQATRFIRFRLLTAKWSKASANARR